MATDDRDPSESFTGLQRPPEDIVRPPGLIIQINEQSPINEPVPVAESNLIINQMEHLTSGNGEQKGRPIESEAPSQDILALDPMEHLRETVLFKASLIAHERNNSNGSGADISMRLEKLGKSHYENFYHDGQLDQVDKALACYTHAIFLVCEEHPKIPRRLERLGLLYNTRFQHARELQLRDHEKAAYYLNRAFTLTPETQSDPSRRLGLTALLYESRFWRTGDPVYGAKAIQDKTQVISMTHESSPELPILFESLGVLHEAQFQRTGQRVDINKAIEYLTLATKLTPNDPRQLESLGISYRTRSLHIASTTLSDIKQALAHLELAVAHTPEHHKERPRRLANLGVAWEARFRRLGNLHDNEQAIRYKDQAVNHTAEDHPDLPVRLESLGVSYETRFQRLGQLDDIEAAIQHLTRAVDLTPKNDVGLPRRLDNLGTCHAALFERLQRPEDSKSSIEYLTRAVKCTPDYHPDLPRLLNNLGMAYKSRFERGRDEGNKRDIKKAIEYLTLAVDITSSRNDDHPDLPLRLDNLGVCYRTRFDPKIDIELKDLQKAIECGEDAVSRMPEDHVGRARQLANLGISYEVWYEHTKSYQHLSKALDCFCEASKIVIAPPRERFRSARHWAKLLPNSTYPASDCLKAYQTAIDLVPHLVLLGTNTRQRYHDLHQVRDLGVEAASMAIRCGKNELALEWLEQTRCVIWNQTLMLRSEGPIDQLRIWHPDFNLTDRLQEVINQLYHSSLEVDSSQENVRIRSKSEVAPRSLIRDQLIAEYYEIISQVRELAGFKDFLQPKRASELIGAARQGPVVIVNCHNSSCDALIIKPGIKDIISIPLKGYTFAKAQSAYLVMKGSLVTRDMRERGFQSIQSQGCEDVLASLWKNVVELILSNLGYMEKTSAEKLPHVTWCPTGIMTFLPLHAAGDYTSQSQPRVFDYVVSSYTPTLTALLSSNPHVLNHDCRIIAIGQPDAKSHLGLYLAPLPGTDKELAFIKLHTADKLNYSQLVGSDATTENVLEAMGQNEWVHLACHARQDINDPAKSCFFLHESTLDLATIARQLFKNKGLAFLSACQTATGDDKLPDEAAHLASCMLVVGYPSVIASMWSVKDDDAPFVADHVYGHLMSCQSIANGEAALALHRAVANLREKVGIMKFERWVQYIHMGL
ncbi:unnamed protein product [Rhizoctonia solani]|uniref:CHAT domain-containing protein n=1 Tax=Rhizoctonia solani TaxID=456999 RepID=A0A8H3DCQ8_9AGAM|nr:unnamed protein product [Rhizoctonia solani]